MVTVSLQCLKLDGDRMRFSPTLCFFQGAVLEKPLLSLCFWSQVTWVLLH